MSGQDVRTIESGPAEPETFMLIRPFSDQDAEAVRTLFVQVNRALAPTDLREAFEAYIALSLREEIGNIAAYYQPERGRGFWVAPDRAGALLGLFGLEPAGDGAAELRRMYVAPEARRCGVARTMLIEAERLCAAAGLDRLVLSTSALQAAALALYHGAGYRVLREEIAGSTTNKMVGAGLRRFYFEKTLVTDVAEIANAGHTPVTQ